MRAQIEATTPIGRFGDPRDIAAAALFLACEDSKFMVGQVISPNGGYVIRRCADCRGSLLISRSAVTHAYPSRGSSDSCSRSAPVTIWAAAKLWICPR